MTRIRYKQQDDGTLVATVNEYRIIVSPEKKSFDIYKGHCGEYWHSPSWTSKQILFNEVKLKLKEFGLVFYDEVRKKRK